MRDNTQKMVLTAMFCAITVLLGIMPWGLIPLGFINVTTLCVPVIIGTMLLGLGRGLILGACFGLCSTLSMFGLTMTPPSGLASALAARSPLLAVIMCMLPRLAVPVVTHFSYRLVARGKEISRPAVPVAAVLGSLTNTVLYLGMMLAFYTMVKLDSTQLLAIIGGTGLIAGGSEAAVAALLSGAIIYAIWKVQRKI